MVTNQETEFINKSEMKKYCLTLIPCVLLIFVIAVSTASAQDFVYRPVNPAFGGDTFNYQWLLNSASEQNDFTQQSTNNRRDPLEDFEENLNRQILNQLSRNLVGNVFGENGLEEGVFEVGTFRVEVSNVLEGVSITIFNTLDGGETNVIVPF